MIIKDQKFKVKCINTDLTNNNLRLTINKEYDVNYFFNGSVEKYIVENDIGVRLLYPPSYFQTINIKETKKIKGKVINELKYYNSIKKIICITKEFKGSTYNGGVIIGEIYDVIEFVPYNHPNGRFRIKGKLDGTSDLFPKELFITVEQHRQNQLVKIFN